MSATNNDLRSSGFLHPEKKEGRENPSPSDRTAVRVANKQRIPVGSNKESPKMTITNPPSNSAQVTRAANNTGLSSNSQNSTFSPNTRIQAGKRK